MKETRMYVRVTEEELAQWKAVALEQGKLLSVWVRDLCIEDVEAHREANEYYGKKAKRIPDVPGAVEVCADEGRESVAARIDDRLEGGHGLPVLGETIKARKGSPACKHGTAKGYRCWQCGGIARVE